MEANQDIQKLIDGIVKTLVDSVPDYRIDHPVDESHGDISVNIAFLLSKELKKAPLEIANEIVSEIEKQKPAFVKKVEVVGGYINFWLSTEFFVSQLESLLKEKNKVDLTTKMSGKKVMFEFTDPNPFKEFHIGHLYSNAVGESLSRLYEALGAHVWRVTYQGDIGLHVAKSVWGMLKIPELDKKLIEYEKKNPSEKAKFLGVAYALGSAEYEKDIAAKNEINELNKKIYEGVDPDVKKVYETGRQWSLDYYESIYERLGSKFIKNYFESEAGPIGLDLVRNHIKDGVFKESDGAIIFEGKKFGLHDRVFVNSLGLPTYEAKDMALPPIKYKDFQYDESIIITAEEQGPYFDVILKALSLINPELAVKTHHIGHGMLRLAQGKMSSRTGNVITADWLLDEAKRRVRRHAGVLRQAQDKLAIASSQKDSIDLPSADLQNDEEEISEMVAVGAVKYAMLRSSIGKDIEFDIETSVGLEGNSGPYLQYSYVRTQSVLTKVKSQSIRQAQDKNAKVKSESQKLKVLEPEEDSLLRILAQFSEVVEEAGEKLSPHVLCNYLYDVSQKFNHFYQKHKIIGSENEEFRLQLTEGVGKVIKKGLYLLGIETPERM